MKNKKEVAGFLIVALLLTSFFSIQDTNAAYTPDLTIIKVSPYYYESFELYSKYVPGYSVDIANYGSGASKNTTMNFYIRTLENKTIMKTLKVPALNAGKGVRLRFSMSNKTDGSFKEGYAAVNPYKSFKEISFTNNARKFSLKEVMLSSSNKTITETYQESVNSNQTFTTGTIEKPNRESNNLQYNNITQLIRVIPINSGWYTVDSVIVPCNGSLHNNMTLNIGGSNPYSGNANEWNTNSLENGGYVKFEVNTDIYSITDIKLSVTGEELEKKAQINDTIIINTRRFDDDLWDWEPEAHNYFENYSCYYTGQSTSQILTNKTASYITNSTSYTVHHSNVIELKVLGNTDNCYVAGWFIIPKGSINNIIGLYGSTDQYGDWHGTEKTASLISNGQYGLSQKIRDIPQIGFKIKGSNIQGFSGFKSLGFKPWTWKEQY
jgi:hypothetical protein